MRLNLSGRNRFRQYFKFVEIVQTNRLRRFFAAAFQAARKPSPISLKDKLEHDLGFFGQMIMPAGRAFDGGSALDTC
jgi:hypothetical protein